MQLLTSRVFHLATRQHYCGCAAVSNSTGCALLPLLFCRDSHIRMWNLLKGRCSYTATLEIEGDMVEFLPSGDAYVLVCGSQVRPQHAVHVWVEVVVRVRSPDTRPLRSFTLLMHKG